MLKTRYQPAWEGPAKRCQICMWEISVYRKRNINAYRARLVTPKTKKKKPQIDQFLQSHKPTYTNNNYWLRSDSNTFHQNSWSGTYSATGKLRAVQEQFYSTYHQRLEFITTRNCTRQNCRRVQLPSTTSHSLDTADLLFLIVNMIHGSFNRHHLMMSLACDEFSSKEIE